MLEYPSGRPQFFACRVGRQMIKTAAAQTIGPLGVLLVNTVAFTEDATNYSRAVTFWDPQLMMILGVKKQTELAAARVKAVKAGWLQYKHGTKGEAGQYFSTIPEHANCLDDAPSDEGFQESKTNTKRIQNENQTKAEQIQNKNETQVQPFFPVPVPIPVPVQENAVPPAEAPPAAIPAEEAVLVFPVTGGLRQWALVPSHVEKLRVSFPQVDVIQEARKALGWVDANSKKTAGGMPKFLFSWMSRANDSLGRSAPRGAPASDPRGNLSAADAVMRRLEEREASEHGDN